MRMIRINLLFIAAIVMFNACNSGSDNENLPTVDAPSKQIADDFTMRFPGVTNITWSFNNEYGYHIGRFSTANALFGRASAVEQRDVEAWYLIDGSCEMVEADFKNGLPANIDEAWKASEYYQNGFTILADAELITRDNKTHIYKLEVMSKDHPTEEGYDLFFRTDGKLLSYLPDINTESNTKNNNLPLPADYKTYIADNYNDNVVLTVYYDEDSALGKVCDIDLFSGDRAYYLVFNDVSKTFYREYSFWMLSQVNQKVKDAILLIDSSATDENTEIERMKDNTGTVFMVQTPTRSFTLDSNGQEVLV